MKHSFQLLVFLLFSSLCLGQQQNNGELNSRGDKCNFETIDNLRAQKDEVSAKLILDFLLAMESSCCNNAEWSEASNETLFWLADTHTKNFIDCLKANKNKLDMVLIVSEFKQPIHDGLDLKGIYARLKKLNDNDKVAVDILNSLMFAIDGLKKH